MSYLIERVYNGHDNSVDLVLIRREVPYPLDDVEEITVTVNGTTISSTNQPTDSILWLGEGYLTGEIRLFLGEAGLPAGEHGAWIVIYDDDHPNGIVWGAIVLDVHAEVEVDIEPEPAP